MKWSVVAVAGGLLLALSLVGLLPMIREGIAVRAARVSFDMERLDPLSADEDEATFRCGGTSVVLRKRPSPGPSSETGLEPGTSPETGPSPEPIERSSVDIQVGDTLLTTAVPVALNRGAGSGSWYWNRIVPFRWMNRARSESECGIAYRLPSDTAAIRRMREDRPATARGSLLESVRGARGSYMYGWRFRVVRWQEGDDAVTERDFAYADWDGDPYGTLVLGLLGSPVGIKNQSLSYWPSLLWPVLYPLGVGLLGAVLLVAGLIGRRRSRAG